MKRILILLILSLFVCNINAQKIIELEESRSGTYKISCKVNGAKMKMIFDTGASNVSLSLSMAKYLFENDYLTKDDFVNVGKASIADGSVVDNFIINIREIEVDGVILNDVKASIIDTQEAPLLFGQSAIQKLGRIEIRGNQLVLLEHGVKDDKAEYNAEDYHHAAMQGDADAQYKLGLCYYKGWGVVQNSIEAVGWLKKSAEQGYAKAQASLGWCYDNGEGVAKNHTEAVKWYTKNTAFSR